MRPRLLDLYCKAGGTSMGYHMAGFDVVGVDKDPQPNYPFEFVQADVTELSPKYIRRHFQAVAGSPPCQRYSRSAVLSRTSGRHPRLVAMTRNLLEETGLPYAIENVEGAPLHNPARLCGSAFGLRVRRHRLFETNFDLPSVRCSHEWQLRHQPYVIHQASAGGTRKTGIVPMWGGGSMVGGYDPFFMSVAVGIDWMTKAELNQAIPPVYTMYVGRRMIQHV